MAATQGHGLNGLPSPRLEFSVGDFLQNQLVDREICHGTLEPRNLRPELLQPLRLIDLHSAVELSPPAPESFLATSLPTQGEKAAQAGFETGPAHVGQPVSIEGTMGLFRFH